MLAQAEANVRTAAIVEIAAGVADVGEAVVGVAAVAAGATAEAVAGVDAMAAGMAEAEGGIKTFRHGSFTDLHRSTEEKSIERLAGPRLRVAALFLLFLREDFSRR